MGIGAEAIPAGWFAEGIATVKQAVAAGRAAAAFAAGSASSSVAVARRRTFARRLGAGVSAVSKFVTGPSAPPVVWVWHRLCSGITFSEVV